jgi:predicted trehalose synthase
MSDNVENLLLEHLRAIRTDLAGLREDLRELKTRQTETHTAVLGLRRDQIHDAETTAHIQSKMDRFDERIDRIERRLDLREQA